MTIRPQVRGGWYHEFEDDAEVISANFINPAFGTAAFPFTATRLDRDYWNAGAAIDVSGSGPWSMVADYEAQFDRERRFHTFTIGARLAF